MRLAKQVPNYLMQFAQDLWVCFIFLCWGIGAYVVLKWFVLGVVRFLQ